MLPNVNGMTLSYVTFKQVAWGLWGGNERSQKKQFFEEDLLPCRRGRTAKTSARTKNKRLLSFGTKVSEQLGHEERERDVIIRDASFRRKNHFSFFERRNYGGGEFHDCRPFFFFEAALNAAFFLPLHTVSPRNNDMEWTSGAEVTWE